MSESLSYAMARKAIKKLYPSWQLFVDEVMDLLEPFWLGVQSREEVHFIHLIGYGKRQKAKEILTELLEILDLQSESIFLWETTDINAPSTFAQLRAFQESYAVFPKVVVTDFFTEYLNEYYDLELRENEKLKDFLTHRKSLDFSYFETRPTSARGSLVISYLDVFNQSSFVRSRLMFQFLWDNAERDMTFIRRNYIPEEIQPLLENGYVRRDEMVFFSKDEPAQILLAIELQKVTQALEINGSNLIGIPIKLTRNAMEYFLSYIFYQKLRPAQLHRAAEDFFLPVFRQYPRMTKKVSRHPHQIQLDFKGGWIYELLID